MIGFSIPDIYFKQGASLELGNILAGKGFKKALVVCDEGIKKAGIVNGVVEKLNEAGVKTVEFSDVIPDPTFEISDAAGDLARTESVDCVVAVGGGSSMDTAKVASILATNSGKTRDYIGRNMVHNPGVPFFAVPTTAGTGSEITSFAVISNAEKGKKEGVMDSKLQARMAILDPELLIGLPKSITAFSGMDALAHAIESYTSILSNPLVEANALAAISLIVDNLEETIKNGNNIEARGNMLLASTMAGMAFGNSSVHVGHAIGHAMGARWHIPHGAACALALPISVAQCGAAVPERMDKIAESMKIKLTDNITPQEKAELVGNALYEFGKKVGIPSLKEFGASEDDIDNIVMATMEEGSHRVSCVPFKEEDCREAYKKLFAME